MHDTENFLAYTRLADELIEKATKDGLYPRIFAYFGPPARVVAGFLAF